MGFSYGQFFDIPMSGNFMYRLIILALNEGEEGALISNLLKLGKA